MDLTSRPTIVQILYSNDDFAIAESLIAELTDVHVVVRRVWPDDWNRDLTVVALLSDQLLADLGGWELAKPQFEKLAQFLPYLMDVGMKRFLSQSEVSFRAVETDRSAMPDQIRSAALVGAENLSAWQSLENRSQRWDQTFSRHDLLRLSEVEPAEQLVWGPAAYANLRGLEQVEKYVASSRARAQRVRRTLTAAIAVATTLILIAGTLAAISAGTESSDAARASAGTADEKSVLLAQGAEDAIGKDPDLPWVLSAAALRSAATRTANDAGYEVTSELTPHRTLTLRAHPVAIVALKDGLAAVGFQADSGLDVINLLTGKSVLSIPGKQITAFDLSPNGKLLATIDQSGVSIRPVSSKANSRTVLGDFSDVEWVSNREVVLTTVTGLELLSTPPESEPRPIVSMRAVGDVSVDPATGRIGFATSDTAYVISALTGQVLYSRAASDTTATVIDAYLDAFVVASPSSVIVVSLRSATTTGQTGERTIAASDTTSVAALSNGGLALGLGTGQIGWVSPGGYAPDYEMAHVGAVFSVESFDGSRVASIGADGFLRLWKHSDSVSRSILSTSQYQATPTGLGLLNYQSIWLNRLGHGADGRTLTVTSSWNDSGMTVSSQTLTAQSQRSFDGITNTLMRPAAGGRLAGFFFSPERPEIQFFSRATVGQSSVDSTIPWTFSIDQTLASASQSNGSAAVASATQIAEWDGSKTDPKIEVHKITSPDDPVYLQADGNSTFTVGASGTTHFIDGKQIAPPYKNGQFTAATMSTNGILFLVDVTGTIYMRTAHGWQRSIDLAPATNPIAAEVSDNGRYFAAIGLNQAQIVDLQSGLIVATFSASSADGPLDDVLFSARTGSATLVWSDLAIGTVKLTPRAPLAEVVCSDRPRPPTAQETSEYRLSSKQCQSLGGGRS